MSTLYPGINMNVKEVGKISRRELEKRLGDTLSCLELITIEQHVMLSPKYMGRVAEGIREQLDEKLKLYSEELAGVPVAYRSIRLKQNNGWVLEDQPHIHFDVIVEYIVFRPTVGATVRAVTNRLSTDEHIGGVVHSLFNVAVPLRHRHSRQFTEGEEIIFKVTDIHVSNDVLSMSGKLLKTDKPMD